MIVKNSYENVHNLFLNHEDILTDASISDICLEWNDKNLIKSPETKDSTVMNESIGACMREYICI